MTEELFTLRDAGLEGSRGSLLSGLDWTVRDHAVTALLGPAGTGKSTLLRALSSRPLDDGWRTSGSWRHRGRELSPAIAPQDIFWVPQVPGARRARPATATHASEGLLDALRGGGRTILLDEPEAGLPGDAREALVEVLRAHRQRGGVVVVTHDLAFARAVADDAALLCAGSLIAQGGAADFFENPPNDLAARFVRDGNCWPPPAEIPPLPSHFHWILPGSLAGMGRPGLLGRADADVTAVVSAGIGLFVTLTEEPLPSHTLPPGIGSRHFPIPDMGVPAIGPTASLCRQIEKSIQNRIPVVVHCHAGMGRTGTILASVLTWMGETPPRAIEQVRAAAPGYIQNRAQADFVSRFAEAVTPPNKKRP